MGCQTVHVERLKQLPVQGIYLHADLQSLSVRKIYMASASKIYSGKYMIHLFKYMSNSTLMTKADLILDVNLGKQQAVSDDDICNVFQASNMHTKT